MWLFMIPWALYLHNPAGCRDDEILLSIIRGPWQITVSAFTHNIIRYPANGRRNVEYVRFQN